MQNPGWTGCWDFFSLLVQSTFFPFSSKCIQDIQKSFSSYTIHQHLVFLVQDILKSICFLTCDFYLDKNFIDICPPAVYYLIGSKIIYFLQKIIMLQKGKHHYLEIEGKIIYNGKMCGWNLEIQHFFLMRSDLFIIYIHLSNIN